MRSIADNQRLSEFVWRDFSRLILINSLKPWMQSIVSTSLIRFQKSNKGVGPIHIWQLVYYHLIKSSSWGPVDAGLGPLELGVWYPYEELPEEYILNECLNDFCMEASELKYRSTETKVWRIMNYTACDFEVTKRNSEQSIIYIFNNCMSTF